MALEEVLVEADRLYRMDALVFREARHAVDEQHRIAVRQGLEDRSDIHRADGSGIAHIAHALPLPVRLA